MFGCVQTRGGAMTLEAANTAQRAVDSKQIGWIGAGKMGGPMAANLLGAGYSVAVSDDTTL